MRRSLFNPLIAIAALFAIGLSLNHLWKARDGILTIRTVVGGTPVTIFRPEPNTAESPPVVLIAHGFAGSQQLMQPFATSLARNGYIAVTFDFLGHGRNPERLTGSITDANGATQMLVNQTARIARFARTLGDGRLAVLGHSMASDIIVRFAERDPQIGATIAVSMFSPAVTATEPRNLLVIVGGWETSLKREALRAVGLASAPQRAQPGTTYGNFETGTARRASFVEGVEHIAVLYSPASMAAALKWLDRSFDRTMPTRPYLDARGPWILLLLCGFTILARPLSHLLPVVSRPEAGAAFGWRALWPCLAIPAVATPLILRVLPTHFLPVLVADYLALHFALYGLLTLFCLRWRRRRSPPLTVQTSRPKLAIAALAITTYAATTLGWSIDSYATSFMAAPERVPLILAMLVGTTLYCLSDEWLTRGGSTRGAYVASKIAFLASLAIAIGLDLERLFFLIIIVPVIILFFVVFGAFSAWSYRQTGNPLAAGAATAIAFAWSIGVTFPMIAG